MGHHNMALPRLMGTVAAAGLAIGLAPPAAAAVDTADTSFPIDETTQLEMHTRVDCSVAAKTCQFYTATNLRTPEGITGFPDDLWARQSTEVRSLDRTTYLDVKANGGPFTKVFKEGGPDVITTIYFGGGPPDKYVTTGTIWPTDYSTGQPRTEGTVIVCAHVQVVYSGVNITSPSTCAQPRFS
ncbi:hypothetical protein [Mycobacterium sp. EPa45]|uniref:hypothetical protein n=1 Tax=Mycobacterium sp. EPa45 TaxID=1545728 RepID=UPI00350F77BD